MSIETVTLQRCAVHKCAPKCPECARQGCYKDEEKMVILPAELPIDNKMNFITLATKELVKLDGGKPPLDLLPLKYLAPVAWVMRGGAKKYSRGGWAKGNADDVNRYVAAVYRHLGAVEAGERLDGESGLPHLAHAACSAVMACGLALINKVLGFEDGWEQKQKGHWS